MQTAGNCFSSDVFSQDSGLGKIGLQSSHCTAHSGDAVRTNSLIMRPTFVWITANVVLCSHLLYRLTKQNAVPLIVSSYSLFHLLWLCLPVWVPGLLEDAPGLVADVALLGAVLLAALRVLWCTVPASVNLFG